MRRSKHRPIRKEYLMGATKNLMGLTWRKMPDQNKIDEWLEKLEGIWTEGSLRNLPSGARAEDERAIEGFGASHGAIPLPNGSVPEGPGTGTEVRIKFTKGDSVQPS